MISDRLLAHLTKLPGARSLWLRFPAGSLDTRIRYGVFERPHYAFATYQAADLAKRLGLAAISVVEFGVAGGRGLIALERIATEVSEYLGVEIKVVGFDSGQGMPMPEGYKDLPYVWGEGYYKMDVAKLKAQLAPTTNLIIGDIAHSVPSWIPEAPIGFIAFDLDYYSSTRAALRLIERPDCASRLPRVYCYFDDVRTPEHACHNEYIGELCAIREFNLENEQTKLCPIHLLRHSRVHQEPWNDQMYAMHDFRHPLYCRNVTPAGASFRQKPL